MTEPTADGKRSPFPLFPDSVAVMPLLYFPTASYYAEAARHGRVVIDCGIAYDKRRKDTHRCDIADTRGQLSLTIPIIKPDYSSRPTWSEVGISTHGQWWDKHLTALESAYGRTPYFEFYIDRFKPFFSSDTAARYSNVTALDSAVNNEICHTLGLPIPLYSHKVTEKDINDYRDDKFIRYYQPEYYQVRKSTLGFIPNLSILDLIFNLGPEAPLYLKRMTQQ